MHVIPSMRYAASRRSPIIVGLVTTWLLMLFRAVHSEEGVTVNTVVGNVRVFDTTNSSLPDNFIRALAIDSSGTVWAGCFREGLAAFDGSKWEGYSTSNSELVCDSVKVLTVDRGNGLWIGTSNGLGYLGDSTWQSFTPANSPMPVSHVWAMDVDKGNKLWFSCGNVDEGGLMSYDDGDWALYTPDNTPLPCRAINAIVVDHSNVTWVGTTQHQGRGGLVRIDGEQWSVYDKTNSPLRRNTVEELALGLDASVWVGQAAYFKLSYDTLEGDLFRVTPDGAGWIREGPCETGLTSIRIDAIGVDHRNRLWAATGPDLSFDYALSVFNGQEWIVLNQLDEVFNRLYVTDMVCDKSGHMWLGTGRGLWRLNISGIDSLFEADQAVHLEPLRVNEDTPVRTRYFDLLGRRRYFSETHKLQRVLLLGSGHGSGVGKEIQRR